MNRRHTLFVLVLLVMLVSNASRALADIQTSEALDVVCLNQLNARQIRFDRTVPYGSNTTVVLDLPAQSQETVCGGYSWIRFSNGLYNRLHITPRYAGPDINRFPDIPNQNGWDCSHSSIEWALYSQTNGTYRKADGGTLGGRFENGHCFHDGRGFINIGHVDATLTNVSGVVVAVQSWQHNDTATFHTGTYCADDNCWWPSQMVVDRQPAVVLPNCPDGSCYVTDFHNPNDIAQVLFPMRMAQDTRATSFVATAVDFAQGRTLPVTFRGSTPWIELLTEDPYYDISPPSLWRWTNRGCIDPTNGSFGHLVFSPQQACVGGVGLGADRHTRYLTTHPYVLGTDPVDVDFQRRPFYTQPVFVTVNNGFFDLIAVTVKFGRADVFVLDESNRVIRAFRGLGPGRHPTVQYDAMTVVITSAGASRFGVDSSHAPVAIESIVVGSP
jgi:hypothetical protein